MHPRRSAQHAREEAGCPGHTHSFASRPEGEPPAPSLAFLALAPGLELRGFGDFGGGDDDDEGGEGAVGRRGARGNPFLPTVSAQSTPLAACCFWCLYFRSAPERTGNPPKRMPDRDVVSFSFSACARTWKQSRNACTSGGSGCTKPQRPHDPVCPRLRSAERLGSASVREQGAGAPFSV